MSADLPNTSIRFYLVRYGCLGRVGWFGTIHQWPVSRGDQVHVSTHAGEWPGEVLAVQTPGLRPRTAVLGELLLPSPQDDRLAASMQTASKLLDAAHAWLRMRSSKSSSATIELPLSDESPHSVDERSGVSILDVEVSLDLAVGVILFLGPATNLLGIAASELALVCRLQRVQWLSVEALMAESPRLAEDIATSQGIAPTPLTVASELRSLHKALHSVDGSLASQAVRAHRHVVGLLGAYLQKTRPSGKRQWMVRIKATAGGLTLGQFRRLAELSVRYGDGTRRLTMRQGLQLHGVALGNVSELLRSIHQLAMTTLGSCGNTVRNVTCCPMEPWSPDSIIAREIAAEIGRRWLPQARWMEWMIDGEPPESFETGDLASADPVYASGYLPHKWKIGVATRQHDCLHVLANDLGLVVFHDEDYGWMVELFVGGALAYRNGSPGRTAMLARSLGAVQRGQLDAVIGGLLRLHREHVVPGPRRTQRLCNLVDLLGTEQIARRLEQSLGIPELWKPGTKRCVPSSAGHPVWSSAALESWTRIVPIFGGRLRFCDRTDRNLPDASVDQAWNKLLAMGQRIHVGPQHTLILHGIRQSNREAVDAWLAGPLHAQVANSNPQEPISRVLTCVALPTCPFALAEAERDEPRWRKVIVENQQTLRKLLASNAHSLQGEISVGLSGCTHGCSHPLLMDVGIIAESSNSYRVFIGGNSRRLGESLGVISGPDELGSLLSRKLSE